MADRAAMPRMRWLTNRVMSAIISRVTGQAIPDSQCGLRVIRTEVLVQVPLSAKRFEIETELLVKAAATRRWKIVSVPVRAIYQGQGSYIRPLRDTVRFLGLLCRSLLRR